MRNISVAVWMQKFIAGAFNGGDVDTQIDAGWYDWFCHDTSLARKTQILGRKLQQIVFSNKIDVNAMYVFFKNNCPLYGTLYDDFRLCDRASGDVIFCVVPRTGHTSLKGRAELWGYRNGLQRTKNDEFELIVVGTWAEIVKWFNGTTLEREVLEQRTKDLLAAEAARKESKGFCVVS